MADRLLRTLLLHITRDGKRVLPLVGPDVDGDQPALGLDRTRQEGTISAQIIQLVGVAERQRGGRAGRIKDRRADERPEP